MLAELLKDRSPIEREVLAPILAVEEARRDAARTSLQRQTPDALSLRVLAEVDRCCPFSLAVDRVDRESYLTWAIGRDRALVGGETYEPLSDPQARDRYRRELEDFLTARVRHEQEWDEHGIISDRYVLVQPGSTVGQAHFYRHRAKWPWSDVRLEVRDFEPWLRRE